MKVDDPRRFIRRDKRESESKRAQGVSGFLAGFPGYDGRGTERYIISRCQIKQLACALTRVHGF